MAHSRRIFQTIQAVGWLSGFPFSSRLAISTRGRFVWSDTALGTVKVGKTERAAINWRKFTLEQSQGRAEKAGLPNGLCRQPGAVILIRNGPFSTKIFQDLRMDRKDRRYFPTPPLTCNEVSGRFTFLPRYVTTWKLNGRVWRKRKRNRMKREEKEEERRMKERHDRRAPIIVIIFVSPAK